LHKWRDDWANAKSSACANTNTSANTHTNPSAFSYSITWPRQHKVQTQWAMSEYWQSKAQFRQQQFRIDSGGL